MASPADSELSPALLKVATHVYRFPLPATKLIAFTKCFADNLGAEETSKSIRFVNNKVGCSAREPSLVRGTLNEWMTLVTSNLGFTLLAATPFSFAFFLGCVR